MSAPERRLVERVAGDAYALGLEQKSVEELRALNAEARAAENEVSFERRLAHARIDILKAELERRARGSGESLIDRLPEILSSGTRESSPGLPERAPDLTVPQGARVLRRRVEELAGESVLARLPGMSEEEIRAVMASLEDHERELSERRRKIQDNLELIEQEIARRYQQGGADPKAPLN